MPSNHLILYCPLLLLSSIFPNIRVFSNESAIHIRGPKYWSFSISPSIEYSELISFRMEWFHLLAVQGTLKSLPQQHSSKASIIWCSAFFMDDICIFELWKHRSEWPLSGLALMTSYLLSSFCFRILNLHLCWLRAALTECHTPTYRFPVPKRRVAGKVTNTKQKALCMFSCRDISPLPFHGPARVSLASSSPRDCGGRLL